MRFFNAIFILYIIIFHPRWITFDDSRAQWIIWNVGQGQWITHIREDKCWHFDFGGERNPITEVTRYCSWRKNLLILSHADWDHYGFINSIRARLKQTCLEGPSWKILRKRLKWARDINDCESTGTSGTQFFIPDSQSSHDDNRKSQIAWERTWLIPGDSPQITERDWLKNKPKLGAINVLVLGHHGSKTSTSVELLKHLPKLQMCIASSRTKKYGHPHKDVRRRILKHCSLVLTQDWNHIHFLTGE